MEQIEKINYMLKQHDNLKKQIKANFDELKQEQNKNDINVSIIFETIYIKTFVFKQLIHKLRVQISQFKSNQNNNIN